MSVSNSSPSRRGSAQITYAGRHRRMLSNGGQEDGASISSGDVESGTEEDHTRNEGKTARSEADTKQPKVQKRVDSLDLPGPSPRHKRSGSKDTTTTSRRKSRTHTRAPSKDMTVSPKTPLGTRSPTELPLSVISSKVAMSQKMKMRMETPEGDSARSPSTPISPSSLPADAGVCKPPKHTGEAERLTYFREHPDVGEVDPHRVFCRPCSKWIKLHATQRYALTAWKAHKLVCSPGKQGKKGRMQMGTGPDSPLLANNDADDDDASSIAPSVSPSDVSMSIAASTATTKRSLEERKRILEEDELTTEVKEHEVFCATCNKWIRLSSKTKYALSNWQAHAKSKHREHGVKVVDGPSSRVQEAERKLQLVNDGQVKELTASSVVCGQCNASVRLSDRVPYDTSSWLAHKAVCFPRMSTTAEVLPDVTEAEAVPPLSPLRRTGSARPPPSSASSERTFVNQLSVGASSPSSPKSVGGTKRAREEDPTDGTTEEERRRSVKPRKESYVPSEAQPPGPWGWFWLPWEAFKRGFAEGWSSTSPASTTTAAATST